MITLVCTYHSKSHEINSSSHQITSPWSWTDKSFCFGGSLLLERYLDIGEVIGVICRDTFTVILKESWVICKRHIDCDIQRTWRVTMDTNLPSSPVPSGSGDPAAGPGPPHDQPVSPIDASMDVSGSPPRHWVPRDHAYARSETPHDYRLFFFFSKIWRLNIMKKKKTRRELQKLIWNRAVNLLLSLSSIFHLL